MRSSTKCQVTHETHNRNQDVTKSNDGITSNYTHTVTGYACRRISEALNIFDVGTDVLDVGMKVFTLLAQIKKRKGEQPLSIPVESWKAICIAKGLTQRQFALVKAYCDALHVYEEKDGFLLVDPAFVLLEEEPVLQCEGVCQIPLEGILVSPNGLTVGGKSHEYH
jgi:hypothetical protein